MTPICSHDTELIQDVVTQEPTSLGIAAGIPEFQLEDNPGMDIMPDTQWSEDEHSLASGETEILEEELHDGEDIQSQRKVNKGDIVTQEPVSPKAINVAAEENPGDVAATKEPTKQGFNP